MRHVIATRYMLEITYPFVFIIIVSTAWKLHTSLYVAVILLKLYTEVPRIIVLSAEFKINK